MSVWTVGSLRSRGGEVRRRTAQPAVPAAIALLCLTAVACDRRVPAAGQVAGTAGAIAAPALFDSAGVRAASLESARVWREPDVPIARADLSRNPPAHDGFAGDADVSCRLSLQPVGGTTPKFNCELPGADVVKVKYGVRNPEVFAEVAATRLLRALGFGADRMYLVRRVRCAGCPLFPFQALKCLEDTGLRTPCFAGGLDYSQHAEIQPAVIERRFRGDRIETRDGEGWAWYELDAIDEARGGSPRADVDALRLLAVFLAHWDNKAGNQRLVCLPGGRRPDRSCGLPFLVVQDLGATFGPDKLDLRNWRQTPVWTNPRTCTVGMKHLPFGGATFPERSIGEAGRRKLLSLLEPLSEAQLVGLFSGSGVTSYDHLDAEARDTRAWASAFQDKVRQIREAGPCRS